MSTVPWSSNFPASDGVNGNTSGAMSADREGFHTLSQLNAWWEVDLGALYDIQEIRLWNRTDCCQSRGRDIQFLFDGVSAGVLPGVPGAPSVWTPPGACQAQVVRLVNGFPGPNFFHLAEVEIFACPA